MSANAKFKIYLIRSFFHNMHKAVRKLERYEDQAFDPISMEILYIVMNEQYKHCGDPITMSTYQLANLTCASRHRIRSRLLRLCRYGLVKCISGWSDSEINKRKPLQIEVNPMLAEVLVPKVNQPTIRTAVNHFVSLGISRLEYEKDLQGFDTDCEYGKEESGPKKDFKETTEKLNNLVRLENKVEANKREERFYWKVKSDDFVKCSSKVWSTIMAKNGFGSSKPNWDGDNISPAATKERRELVKTFQQYGGRITALAWWIFVGGSPIIDDNKRPKYLPQIPHRQFVSSDKKPSQFAKHFNAILQDKYFIDASKGNWKDTSKFLESWYGEILHIGSRDMETTYDKLGYSFGDMGPNLGEIRV
jgi:hypothetical protein